MPIKDGVIAYGFLKELLELMKTGKDNNDETFRRKSELLMKEDEKLYSTCVLGYLAAEKKGNAPKTIEDLAGVTLELFESCSYELSRLMTKAKQ